MKWYVCVIYIDIILELFGYAIVMSEMIYDMWFISVIKTHGRWELLPRSKKKKRDRSYMHFMLLASQKLLISEPIYVFCICVLFESIYTPI